MERRGFLKLLGFGVASAVVAKEVVAKPVKEVEPWRYEYKLPKHDDAIDALSHIKPYGESIIETYAKKNFKPTDVTIRRSGEYLRSKIDREVLEAFGKTGHLKKVFG